MFYGLGAGLAWAAETVLLGLALSMSPFVTGTQAAALAPFAAAFLHDACSALFMTVLNLLRGKGKETVRLLGTRGGRAIALAAVIGGPVGMTGYILTVHHLGPSFGAVASAVYPAVGAVLAWIFLKEKMQWYRWVFLALTLFAVYGLSYSPGMEIRSFWLGLAGVLMCALGWGSEAVILAHSLRSADADPGCALQIRQTVSAIVHGLAVLPLVRGWTFTADLLRHGASAVGAVALAALAATVSYLLYYLALARIGASRTMALNISYAAWAPLLALLFLGDRSILGPLPAGCAAAFLIFGILAAAEPLALKNGDAPNTGEKG